MEILPYGLCADCLSSVENGAALQYVELGGERGLWVIYCQHNRCGAYTFVGPAGLTQWTMHIPIEALDFTKLVRTTVEYYLDAERRYDAPTSGASPGEA